MAQLVSWWLKRPLVLPAHTIRAICFCFINVFFLKYKRLMNSWVITQYKKCSHCFKTTYEPCVFTLKLITYSNVLFYLHYFIFPARKCMKPVPPHFLGMDVVWPGRRRDLGTTIYYKCPFRSSTGDNKLTGKECL